MDAWVIDSSVVVRQLFIDEPFARQAQSFLARMDATPPARLLAPDLLYAECASALWKYVRFNGFDAQTAREHLADVRQLPFEITPITDLVDRALVIGISLGISVYDACYVALAEREGCGLVTLDERLVRDASGGPVLVQPLGTL
jgi:predicted nucleic acid-binding protein